MSYVNLNNPANFQLQEFEQLGFRYIVSGRPTIGGETYRTIFVLTDAVVTATCPNGDSLSSETLVAGTVIHGFFEDVSVASGSLLAYKAGPITAQEIFDAYKAYVYAQGGIVEGESCAVADIAALLEDKLYSAASLVLIPSGYKVSHLYAERPLDSNGDFTFTRASSATRIAPNGLLEKVRTNLNIYSSDFGNGAYITIEATRTTGQSDPFGTSTATRFLETTATNKHGVFFGFYNPPSTGEITQSIYVKDAGRGAVNFSMGSRAIGFVFTFATETISNVVGSPIAYSATPVGNNWYRLSLTFNVAAGSPINHTFVEGYNGSTITYAGDVTKGFIISAAQLEYNVGASPYIATNGSAVSVGPVANLPRLDYLGSSCPRLLLEPQRTNLLLYSEQLNNSYWFKGGSGAASAPVVTANYAISPDGYQNADRVYFDAVGTLSADRSSLIRDFAFTTGQTYTISGYAKSATGANQILQFRIAGAQVGGELTATSEWQRFSVTHTATTSTTDNFGIQLRGNNTETTSDLLLYGLQLELASYATSYVPTLGAAVTRTVDSASKTGISSLIGQTEGTLFVEVDTAVLGDVFSGNSRRFLTISDGTTTNRVIIFQSFIDDSIQFLVSTSGVAMVSFTTSANQSGIKKIAIAYANNDFAAFMNGVLVGSSASGSVPACSRVGVGSFENTTNTANAACPVSQALLFKTRLSNAQLAELTTL